MPALFPIASDLTNKDIIMPDHSYATLATVLERLHSHPSLPEAKCRELASSVHRICTYLGKAPEDVPATPKQLRHLLSRLHPVQANINARSLANVKSNLAKALRETGLLPPAPKPRPQTRAWRDFLSAAKSPHHAWKLSRFITFCGLRRIEPEQVTDATLALYGTYLETHLIGNDPVKLCAETIQTWNCIARAQRDPLPKLTPLRSGRYICPPLLSYPTSLQDEFQGYLERLAHKDIFADGGPDKPLKPVTLRNIKAAFRQYLGALQEAGLTAETFTSLRAVVTVELIRTGAKVIHARLSSPKRTPTALHGMVATLLAIARHHLHLPDTEVIQIQRIKKQTVAPQRGMSNKNRDRLGQFDDWANVVRLMSLTFYAELSNKWAHEHYDNVVLQKFGGGNDHG